jgi:ethanolamine utilization protein EutP (predicted NTPase)
MSMTKQLTITWTDVPATGLSLIDYTSNNIFNLVKNKREAMLFEGKTDAIQYNPLVNQAATTGLYLNKYTYYTTIRLWSNQEAIEEYISFLNQSMQELSINYPYEFEITDIDPDLNYHN